MALARRLTSLGRAARSEASVKVRQPLCARRWCSCPPTRRRSCATSWPTSSTSTRSTPADELSEVLTFELVPNFRTLGPRLGDRVKELKPALAALDGAAAAAALEAGRSITVTLGGEAGRALARRRGAAGPRPAGLRRLARGRRGGGARPRPSTTGCASGAWPATSCASCRTCARRAGWRSPTGSGCTSWASTPWPSTSTSSPARCWPSRSWRARDAGVEGTVLELDDELLAQPVRVWIEKVEGAPAG